MTKRVFTYRLLAFVLTAFFVVGCSNTRRLERGKPLRQRSPGFLIKANQESEFTFDYVGMKLSADLDRDGKTTSFKANVRMKRDSIIWVSISPALGVEVVRMVVTPDSVKYVSKVPGDKHYYLGDFSVIADVAGVELDFRTMQDLLVGNAVFLDKQEDKYESRIQDQQYVLISKLDRKLRKVLNADEKNMVPDTHFTINPLDKDYQKMRRRAKPEELQLKRFWLNPIHHRVERALLNDYYDFRELEIAFEDYEEKDGQWYPEKGRLTVKDEKLGSSEIRFEVSRLRVGKVYDFPFSIPDGYERRYAP